MRGTIRLRLAVLLAGLALLVTGCSGGSATSTTTPTPDGTMRELIDRIDVPAFLRLHPGLFVDTSTESGMESISLTTYDPTKPPPARQEVVGFGHLSANPSRLGDRVYSVFVLEGERFYTAEFEADTRVRLSEEGTWFLSTDRDAYVADRLATIDALLATAG